MGFINKSWQRNMSSNLVSAGERVGGAVTASFLLKKFAPNKGANATAGERTMYNVGGPALLLTSVALDLVASNEHIRSLAQGMSVAAATHSIAVIAPSVGESFGLSGVEEQENSAALMGASGNAPSALSAGDTLPEEFDDVKNFQTDGNPWTEVADKIDDPNTTVKVEGVDDSKLMGDEDTEEVITQSALMGLF